MGECGLRSLCTIILVTALLATYLILEGTRPAPSTTGNQREYLQEVVQAEKSDRLEAIKEILSKTMVRLEKYYRPTDDTSKHRLYLAYYTYSEVPPDKRPADIALDSLKDVPVGKTYRRDQASIKRLLIGLQFYEGRGKDRI
jgi:hypothetical protein